MPILLIFLGLILIGLNYIALQKDGSTFKDILKKSEKEFTEEKLEVGMIRHEMAETITELQKEIYNLREELANYKKEEAKVVDKVDEIISEEVNENAYLLRGDKDVVSQINFTSEKKQAGKREKIMALIKDGLTDDEICNKLALGKGEVLLVRSLYKS